jgi:hypothetical protein
MKKPLSYYKQLAVEFWSFLRDHPEIADKTDAIAFPRYKEIVEQVASCPCCTAFQRSNCEGCPLFFRGRIQCINVGQPFRNWFMATTDAERQAAATALLAQLEAWETED